MLLAPEITPNAYTTPLRRLLGPGPSDISTRVLQALAKPTIGYLDPSFVGMMEELKALLRYAFQTKNALTFPVSGPGSAGMEMCFVNMVDRGDKVIVCRNGVFGNRMVENVERCGGQAIIVDDVWGQAVDLNKVEEAFKQYPDAKVLAFVHAETSTGALSDARALCALAQRYGALTIVDAVTSLGGVPVLADEWGADAIYSGSQKCLSCTPGLSPITFSDRVVAKVQARPQKSQSWFLDLNLLLGYWGETTRTYHHTAPTNSLYALHEALLALQQEGLEQAWARHKSNHEALKAGLAVLDIRYVVEETSRLPQLNSIYIPQGLDDKLVRTAMLQEHGIEIGAGLGALAGKIWRIGLMGYSSRVENVVACLAALESVLISQGYACQAGQAVAAAYQSYAQQSLS
ncbi:pyridoxal-phosphate-dependent aminotransferase family protein [Agitococcus lubricus]|uniref:Alanine-glyoxylate aminotransferase n=1 Tax=Agitococcus lubricus TaxID=1077255 RepID=A0A2T5IV00_9GAMM|nr:alanine--glyoxylate aminotransferase family protein [Agitococcus lubricus]PTQ87724.1 alanine-glyoxylate aminotransferase [Agitococcus lubricus]